jgi:hypothetical protein
VLDVRKQVDIWSFIKSKEKKANGNAKGMKRNDDMKRKEKEENNELTIELKLQMLD